MKGKRSAAVPLSEKTSEGKTLNLSYSTKSGAQDALIKTLPENFRANLCESLRKLDLSNQSLLKLQELNQLRFAGQTLTWLNLTGIPIGVAASGASVSWAMWMKLCTTLFVLNMSSCGLTELPKELAGLTSLKALVASHNSLTSSSLSNLSSLRQLNTIILSDNNLTSLPSSLTGLGELKKLNLANNKLTSDALPDLAPLQPILEELRLNGNAGIVKLPTGLDGLDKLTILELSNTGMSDWEEVEKLAKCRSLVNLGLRGTKLAATKDYRDKVIAPLPTLRILDNTRFDPKFLQRKEKLAKRIKGGETSAGTASEEAAESSRSATLGANRRATGTEPSQNASAKKLGKRRQLDNSGEDEEELAPQAKSRRTDVHHDPTSRAKVTEIDQQQQQDAVALADVPEVSVEDAAAAAKKREKKQKKAAKIKSAKAAYRGGKEAKSVGGSLAAPSEKTEESEVISGADPLANRTDAASLEEIAKKRSSVVGVVDVRKADKARQKDARKAKPVQPDKPDVLSLLQGSKESDVVVRGWD